MPCTKFVIPLFLLYATCQQNTEVFPITHLKIMKILYQIIYNLTFLIYTLYYSTKINIYIILYLINTDKYYIVIKFNLMQSTSSSFNGINDLSENLWYCKFYYEVRLYIVMSLVFFIKKILLQKNSFCLRFVLGY